MPQGPNVAGMVNDPDFQSLAPADKRTALTKATGDDSFSSLNDGETMQFVSRFAKTSAPPSPFTSGDFQTMQASPIQNTNRLGSQPLQYQSMGAAVSGAMARGQMPNFPQQVQQSASRAAGYAPMIGATIGSIAGLPGAALGAGIGNIAEHRMRGEPASYTGAIGDAALTYATGKAVELAPRGLQLAKGMVNKLAGVPEATAEATAKYSSDLADQAEATRQRVNKFKQEDIDAATANKENQAKYQSDLAEAQSKIPAAPPGQQELWVDLNKSVQVPASGIKVKMGATDLTEAMTMPGRGMAQEGLKAADLAKMTPPEQNAVLAPKWHAAGQKIDTLAEQATAAGKIVDVRSIDNAVNNIVDENQRKGMNRILTRIGKGMGLRGSDWTNITPTQALALKRALWETGENGEYVARAVSGALRDQVPELKAADQQYSDLNGAMDAIRKQYTRYSTGQFKPPSMNPGLPQPPTPVTPPTPSYGATSKVAPAGAPPDLKAIQDALVKKFAWKAARSAVGLTGGGYAVKKALDLAESLHDPPKSAEP